MAKPLPAGGAREGHEPKYPPGHTVLFLASLNRRARPGAYRLGALAGFGGADLASRVALAYLNGHGPGELELVHRQGRDAGSHERRIDFGVDGQGVALGGAAGQ